MPLLLDVKATVMAGVELPPHPDKPSVRRVVNPESNSVTIKRFTDTSNNSWE